MANLRDKGFSSSTDNYNHQQAKKRKEEEERKKRESTQGPVSALKAEQLKKNTTPSKTAKNSAANTGRAASTSGFSGTGGKIDAPSTSNSITKTAFDRSPTLQKIYGTYDNYTSGMLMTAGGYTAKPDTSQALSKIQTLNWKASAQAQAHSFLRENQERAKKQWDSLQPDDYERTANEAGLTLPHTELGRAKARFAFYSNQDKALDAQRDYWNSVDERDAIIDTLDTLEKRRMDTVRDQKTVQGDIDSLNKEIAEHTAAAEKADQDAVAYARMLGTPGAKDDNYILEQMMNAQDRAKSERATVDALRQYGALLDEEKHQAFVKEYDKYAYTNLRDKGFPGSISGDRGLLQEQEQAKKLQDEVIASDPQLNGVYSGESVGRFGSNAYYTERMTDREKRIYSNLTVIDSEKADEYFQGLKPTLEKREREKWESYAREAIDELDPMLEAYKNGNYFERRLLNIPLGLSLLAPSIMTTLAKPLEAGSRLAQKVDRTLTGEANENAIYNLPIWMTNATRDATGKKIDEFLGTDGEDWAENWGSFGYQTAMSMLDFAYTAFLTGNFGINAEALKAFEEGARTAEAVSAYNAYKTAEALSLTLMGTEVAAETYVSAKDRGLSDSQAWKISTAAGFIEAATEVFSIENLMSGLGDMGVGQYVAKNMIAESSEEVASEILNWALDVWVSKDQSEWHQSILKYQREHPNATDEETLNAVWQEQMNAIGMAGLGGALSGGVLAGVQSAKSSAAYNSELRSTPADNYLLENIIRRGMTSDPESRAYRTASNLAQKLEAGDFISERDYQKAANRINRNFMLDMQKKGAEVLGRRILGEDKAVLASLAQDVISQGTTREAKAAREILSQIQNGEEIDPTKAGNILLTVRDIQQRKTVTVNDVTLTPREVTEGMTDLEKTAAEIGVDEATTKFAGDLANLFGADVRFTTMDPVYYIENKQDGTQTKVTAEEAEEFRRTKAQQPSNLVLVTKVKAGKFENGILWVNAYSKSPILSIISHEMTHNLEETDSYQQLYDLVMEGKTEEDIQAKIEEYAEGGVKLDDEEAKRELVSDYIEENLLKSERDIQRLVQNNRNLAEWVLDQIDKVLAAFGSENAQSRIEERAVLQKAREYYAQALKELHLPQENIDNANASEYNNLEGDETLGLHETSGEELLQDVPESDRLVPEGRDDGQGNLRVSGRALLSDSARHTIESRGIVPVDLHESTDNAFFSSSLEDARNSSKNGWAVSPKDVDELQGQKVFITENGSAGVVVTQDGDIEAVFANHDKGAPRGSSESLMAVAIENGGKKLDCYGPQLAKMYARYGFIPVARVEFNPEYADPLWDESRGSPDIYVMYHNGDDADTALNSNYVLPTQEQLDSLPLMDYDDALAYRDSFLDKPQFKMDSPVEESGTLVAAHNLDVDNLRALLKLSGIPAISIGVVRNNKPYTKFGEYSLLFDRATIDPQENAANKVYGGDTFTPTLSGLPMDYKVNYREVSRINQRLNRLLSRVITPGGRAVFRSENLINPGIAEDSERGGKENIVKDLLKKFQTYAAYAVEHGNRLDVGSWMGRNGRPDSSLVWKDLQKNAPKAEVEAWLNDLVGDAISDRSQIITDDNLSLPYEDTHVEATPENIVNAMYSYGEKGIGLDSYDPVMSLVAYGAKEFNSIDEIHQNEQMLENGELYDEFKNDIDNRIADIAARTGNLSKKYVYDIMTELLRDGYTEVDDIIAAFDDAGENIREEDAWEIKSIFEEIKEFPTTYFEAKPGRVIGWNEVRAVVAPDNIPDDIRKALEDKGIEVLSYKTGNNKDRLAKVNSVPNTAFKIEGYEESGELNLPKIDESYTAPSVQRYQEAAAAAQYMIDNAKTEEERAKGEAAMKAAQKLLKKKKGAAAKAEARSKPTEARRWLSNRLIESFGIPDGMKRDASILIQQAADRVLSRGQVTEEDVADLFYNLLYEGVVKVNPSSEMQVYRDEISGNRLYISPEIKAELGDDYNILKQQAARAGIPFTVKSPTQSSNVMGYDMLYKKLQEIAPGVFRSTSPKEMIQEMIRVAEGGQAQDMPLTDYFSEMAKSEGMNIDEEVERRYNEFEQDFKTFSEMAKLESKIRDKTSETIAKEKAKFREALEKARAREAQKAAKQNVQNSINETNKYKPSEEDVEEIKNSLDDYALMVAAETGYQGDATASNAKNIYDHAIREFTPSEQLRKLWEGIKTDNVGVDEAQALSNALTALSAEYRNRNRVLGDTLMFDQVYSDTAEDMKRIGNHVGKGNFFSRTFHDEMLTPMNFLRRLVGWNPNSSFLRVMQQLERGEREYRAYKEWSQQMVDDFLKENEKWLRKASGEGKNGIWYSFTFEELEDYDGEYVTYGKPVTVEMTPLQLVALYLDSKGEDNMYHIIQSGRTFANREYWQKGDRQNGKNGITAKMSPDTVEDIVSTMNEKEMELANILEQYYNGFAKEWINRVSNELDGYDRAHAGYYYPISVNEDVVKYNNRKGSGNNSLKARKEGARGATYNVDALDMFNHSVEQAARYIAYAIPERNFKSMMDYRGEGGQTRVLLRDGPDKTGAWGEEGLKHLEKIVNDVVTRDGRNKSLVMGEMSSKIWSNSINAMFSMNPSIFLKQFASYFQVMSMLGMDTAPKPKQLLKVDRELINKYTAELAYRERGYATPETAQVVKGTKQYNNKAANFLFRAGSITAADSATVGRIWSWAENYVKKNFPDLAKGSQSQINNGESEFYKKVAEVFNDAVNTTQPMYDEMHRPDIMKDATLFERAFTMFKTVPFQQYNTMRRMFGELSYANQMYKANPTEETKAARSEAAKGAARSILATTLSTLSVETIAFLNALLLNKGKRYKDKDKDEITAKSFWNRFGVDLFSSMAGNVAYGEEIVEALATLLLGEKWYDIDIPGAEQLNDVISLFIDGSKKGIKFTQDIVDVINDGGDVGAFLKDHAREYAGDAKDLAIKVAKYFKGLPLENLEKYIMGALQFSPEVYQATQGVFSEVAKSDLKGLTGEELQKKMSGLFSARGVDLSDESTQELSRLYEQAGMPKWEQAFTQKASALGETLQSDEYLEGDDEVKSLKLAEIKDMKPNYSAAVPTDAPDSLSVYGEDVTLTAPQKQMWEKTWSETASSINDLISSHEYQAADDDEKRAMLDKLYDLAKYNANMSLGIGWETDDKWQQKANEMNGVTPAQAAAWYGASSGKNDQEKFRFLSSASWSDVAKYEIFTAEKGSDAMTDSGNLTTFGKLQRVIESGGTVSDYIQWLADSPDLEKPDQLRYLAGSTLSDDVKAALYETMGTVSASEQSTAQRKLEFARKYDVSVSTYLNWLADTDGMTKQEDLLPKLADYNISDDDKVTLAATVLNQTQVYKENGDLTTFGQLLSLIDDGVPVSDALRVKAVEGVDEYNHAMKVNLSSHDAVLAAQYAVEAKNAAVGKEALDYAQAACELYDGDPQKTKLALAAILDDSEYNKIEQCEPLGVPADMYIAARLFLQEELNAVREETGNQNKGVDQDIAKAALDKMNVSQEMKAYLFQMYNKGWHATNNPYGSGYGSAAYNAMHQ